MNHSIQATVDFSRRDWPSGGRPAHRTNAGRFVGPERPRLHGNRRQTRPRAAGATSPRWLAQAGTDRGDQGRACLCRLTGAGILATCGRENRQSRLRGIRRVAEATEIRRCLPIRRTRPDTGGPDDAPSGDVRPHLRRTKAEGTARQEMTERRRRAKPDLLDSLHERRTVKRRPTVVSCEVHPRRGRAEPSSRDGSAYIARRRTAHHVRWVQPAL